jgi:hypothetical protein
LRQKIEDGRLQTSGIRHQAPGFRTNIEEDEIRNSEVQCVNGSIAEFLAIKKRNWLI